MRGAVQVARLLGRVHAQIYPHRDRHVSLRSGTAVQALHIRDDPAVGVRRHQRFLLLVQDIQEVLR